MQPRFTPRLVRLDDRLTPATFAGTGATIVAVVDSGLDLTHPDLAGRLWTNPGEVPGNGRDDDGNGFADDIHGYDFADHDADPADVSGHGTHVAGIIGATADDGFGVSGVNGRATLLPVRFLDAHGDGSATDAAAAIDYAVACGARVVNASWTISPTPALEAAIGRAQTAGVVVVAAAGNGGVDLDASPVYPASYAGRYDNVVAVASADATGRLAADSNRGRGVALAAPGVDVLSTLPGGGYGERSGTSMAAGFVSGAVALLWDQHPDWSYQKVLATLLETVDPLPELAGVVATSGRLNVARMIAADPVPSVAPTTEPIPTAPPAPPPASLPPRPSPAIAAGSDRDGPPRAALIDPDGTVRLRFKPFAGRSAGGVRVAAADLTGDGVTDLVAGTGPGGPAEVAVLDGATGADVYRSRPFEAGFFGGVFVAAGDLTGDGVPELVVSPDEGGGPRVRVLDGRSFAPLADFFGIDDPAFRGGARVAIGDVTGDGVADVVVAAGVGGGPRVTVWDGATVRAGRPTAVDNFFVFEPTLRNGVYVAAGDLDADGFAEVVAGGGPGGGPRVMALSGRELAGGVAPAVLTDFFAGDPLSRDGVTVAVKTLDADGLPELVAGLRMEGEDRVVSQPDGWKWGGLSRTQRITPFPEDYGGVFVG